MSEISKAVDELEKTTSRLVKVSAELMERTEKLNQQLQRLAETLKRQNQLGSRGDASDTSKHLGQSQGSGQSEAAEILSEVKKLLDGT
jgi:septation ring formation regulator EzrA